MNYIPFGSEVIRGYEVASFPYETKEEAYKELREGKWPTDVYQVRYYDGGRFYNGGWYIMAKKP